MTGSAGLLPSSCTAVPCPGFTRKENCSQIPPPLHRGTKERTESIFRGQRLSLSLSSWLQKSSPYRRFAVGRKEKRGLGARAGGEALQRVAQGE